MKTLIIFMSPKGVDNSELINYLYDKLSSSKTIILNQNIICNKENNSLLSYYDIVNKWLQKADYTILDSYEVLIKDRLKFFENINIKNINIIGVWVEASKKDTININFNKSKEEQFSLEEINYSFKYKASPIAQEPFNDIIYIIQDINMGISKKHPYLTDIKKTLDRIKNEN